jgi:ankyrin repeat protein
MECLTSMSFVPLMQDGATVLHHAARVANSFAIKAMLRANADINACDNVNLLY